MFERCPTGRQRGESGVFQLSEAPLVRKGDERHWLRRQNPCRARLRGKREVGFLVTDEQARLDEVLIQPRVDEGLIVRAIRLVDLAQDTALQLVDEAARIPERRPGALRFSWQARVPPGSGRASWIARVAWRRIASSTHRSDQKPLPAGTAKRSCQNRDRCRRWTESSALRRPPPKARVGNPSFDASHSLLAVLGRLLLMFGSDVRHAGVPTTSRRKCLRTPSLREIQHLHPPANFPGVWRVSRHISFWASNAVRDGHPGGGVGYTEPAARRVRALA